MQTLFKKSAFHDIACAFAPWTNTYLASDAAYVCNHIVQSTELTEAPHLSQRQRNADNTAYGLACRQVVTTTPCSICSVPRIGRHTQAISTGELAEIVFANSSLSDTTMK